jgi:very-short-patch-repair endonuclease
MEDRMLSICEGIGFPRPEVNVWFPDLKIEVDFLWRALRLIAEADSQEHHGTPSAREADYRRDSRLRRRGWRVERFSWREIFLTPEVVAETLSAAASAR